MIIPTSSSQKKPRATIKQVAQAAGVSAMTVSRVINDHPDVSAETRAQVRSVIQELGYRPNSLARSLIRRRSLTLGVVTAGLKFIGPSRTLNGITTQAEKLGYHLFLYELPRFDTDDVWPILDAVLERQVDGILWAVPEIGANRQRVYESLPHLPVPMIFLTMQPKDGQDAVATDNARGGWLAVEHLLEQGCRSIGHISGPLDWWEARQRKLGWQQALEQAGMPTEPHFAAEGSWSTASGEAAFEQLLFQYPQMDAVFVANDQMALGVLYAAHRRGLRVPQDLAVVGFDNLPESPYFWPSLTTIQIDQQELGAAAVRLLVERIEPKGANPSPQPNPLLLRPELVVRSSSVPTGS